MNDLMEILFTKTWWSWPQADPGAYAIVYRSFNLVEAAVWCGFGVGVAHRYVLCRRSTVEVVYAGVFVVFGVTDFVEASCLTSWLIWWKLFTLIFLLALRRYVISSFYPQSRLA